MTTICALPSAALQVIFAHLCNASGAESAGGFCTVAAARLTCKRWTDVSYAAVNALTPKSIAGLVHATRKFKALTSVNLKYIRSIDPSAVACFSQLHYLSCLRLADSTSWYAVRSPILQALSSSCPFLTHLEVSAVTDTLAGQLAQLTQLHCLSVSGKLTDRALHKLTTLQQVQQLSISCCDAISDEGLTMLTCLSLLRNLQLHSCLQLGDVALALLAQLTQLTALSLSHSCEDATGTGLMYLTALKNLRELNLSAASEGASPTALAQLLAALPQLTLLDVSYCEHVGPAVVRAIAGLSNIAVLGMSGINPGSLHSLRSLKSLSKLQQLQMRWIGQLKDIHASFLPHLGSLTALDLSYCRSLSTTGLQQLQWLTQLKVLNLMSVPVGGDDLSCLQAMKQLTALTVSLLAPVGQSWQHIGGLQHLQTLALRRCTISMPCSKRIVSSSSGGSSNSSIDTEQTQDAAAAAAEQVCAEPSISCLTSLQRLTALDCSNSSVDAAAVIALQQLPMLRHISLARCHNVTNGVLHALECCTALRKLDLRLRGSGCTWNIKGLLQLLHQLRELAAVYVTETPSGLPDCEECRVLVCSSEQVPLSVGRDVGHSIGLASLF